MESLEKDLQDQTAQMIDFTGTLRCSMCSNGIVVERHAAEGPQTFLVRQSAKHADAPRQRWRNHSNKRGNRVVRNR